MYQHNVAKKKDCVAEEMRGTFYNDDLDITIFFCNDIVMHDRIIEVKNVIG